MTFSLPELPEVETIRRGLAPLVEGARIVAITAHRPDLRFALPENLTTLAGQAFVTAGRRGKYLLFQLSSGQTLLSHLGMTGSYRFDRAALSEPSRYHVLEPGKHDHVDFSLSHPVHGEMHLIYSDPRRFGFFELFKDEDQSRFVSSLGVEPLGNAFNAEYLAQRFAARRAPIKAALLDQKIIAGLGNIYVSEALWRAGIAPQTAALALVTKSGAPRKSLERLTKAVRDVLEDAIAAGGSTLRDFKNAEGGGGYFQHSFDVYDREGEPCRTPGCAGRVLRIVQSGRSSFYCPACQSKTG